MTAALILGLALVAQAAPISVRDSSYREGTTSRGSRYYTFDFSDRTETVLVIALGEPRCQFGP